MINQIVRGDCLEVMRQIPDSSIDLILTDPPYFKFKSEDWDRQWDKAEHFLEWIDKLCIEWQRVLKPNGSLYCFASPGMSARVEVTISKHFTILNRLIWDKSTGGGRHRHASKESLRAFFPASEFIIFAEQKGADNTAKGEAGYLRECDRLRGFVFEPIRAYLDGEREKAGLSVRDIAVKFRERTGSRTVTGMAGHWFTTVQWTLPTIENYVWLSGITDYCYFLCPYEQLRQQYEQLRQQYEQLRRPFSVSKDVPFTDVWRFPVVQSYKDKHPCEKPLSLLEHTILSSSRPGDLVLDCFAGSGSILKAAQATGRQYIGIEIDPVWVDRASERLKTFQLRMFN